MREKLDRFLDLYTELKQAIRYKDNRLYERWKAGGFIVDEDILSMYPNLVQVVEALDPEEEESEDEEE